jgi:DDE superfamily endonuclease/Tc5 transposase DNA-binding domain
MMKRSHEPAAKKRKSGPAVGTTYKNDKSLKDWYIACRRYVELESQGKAPSYGKYLSSDELSDPRFKGTAAEQSSFSKKLKKFKEGKLKPSDNKREKPSQFPNLEEKLIAYINLRAAYYKYDKCGVSYGLLKAKAYKFAKEMEIDGFQASNGWLHNTLKRHGKIGVSLHGEADTIPLEVRLKTMEEWKTNEFHQLIEKYNVKPEHIYNADQTGLFYQKLPNRIYIDKANKKDYAGAKQMKDKTRITLMVCTAADGSKVPLSVVGRSKNPVCFRACENNKPPLPYTDQVNAWFDQNVTLWWINTVFIPHHRERFGDTHCILIVDNCSAHKIDLQLLPGWCHMIFLPPNMTSNFQPADMGMIASLKIGYKVTMLHKLLEIFDGEGGFEGAANIRKTIRRGQRGLEYGGKATVLDAMKILKSLWDCDGRYATEDGIRRCWRKASILPNAMNVDINADIGSASTSLAHKTLKKEDCDDLCQLMTMLKVKATEVSLDCRETAVAFQDSFVAEPGEFTPDNYVDMIDNWICIEDEKEVINAICDDEIEALESIANVAEINDAIDDDEPDPQPMDIDDVSRRLTFVQAVEMITQVKENSHNLGAGEELNVHLDRYLRGLRAANAKKSRRDTTLHSYFTSKK